MRRFRVKDSERRLFVFDDENCARTLWKVTREVQRPYFITGVTVSHSTVALRFNGSERVVSGVFTEHLSD